MIFAAWCACCVMSVAAQDCEISLTIAKAAQKEELPSQVQEILGNRLAAFVGLKFARHVKAIGFWGSKTIGF